ncbi:MAG: 2Fe-2S iron-sulfur cluster-binding protein [Spirochaetia bacterium]|jgi:ferredoxin|nr:2Fe-2S iron-sulfur cluster-binding protein [Spirochaetia bacterium]
MIISLRSISYDDLKKQLCPEDKIVILSCDTCVKACGIGGSARMKQLTGMLQADGYTVLGIDLISIGCTMNLVAHHRDNRKEVYDEATVVIPLICEDGLVGVRKVFADKKIIQVAKTVGIGNFTMDKGVVLTHPFESTGLAQNDDGYPLAEVAKALQLFPGFFDEKDGSPSADQMVKLTVDGKEIAAPAGQNLLAACLANSIDVPHLCFQEDLSAYGACRLCLVKIKGRKGLVPACCTHVEAGMDVCTDDAELQHCRRIILELAMASGHHDCLTCVKGVPSPFATCELQKYVRAADITESRFASFPVKLPEDDSSPVIFHDPNRCILCGRCVRACQELSGLSNLGFVNRGDRTVVVAGLNTEMNQSDCAACMACVNVCPTGALTEKVVYFSGKDWTPSRKFMSL